MQYGKIARALLTLGGLMILWIGGPSANRHTYQKQRRKRPQETLPKTYEIAAHPTEEEHRAAEQHQWRANILLSKITAGSAFIAVILTYCTFQATREQAQDGHTNLILSEAAFVYGNPVKAQNALGQSPPSVLFIVPIGNSGSTQTRGLRYQIACTSAVKFSQVSIEYPEGHSVSEKILLGPRAEVGPVGCQTPYSDLLKYKAAGESLFIYGNMTYYDVVSRETPHKTEFCYVETFADVQTSSFNSFTTSCPAYNCADDECPDYANFVRSMKNTPRR